jgi:hypothetical protein
MGAGRNGDYQVVRVVVPRIEFDVVLGQEDVCREPGKSLVPVDERVVAGQRMQQRRRLSEQIGIRVLAEDARARPVDRGLEQTDVADVDRPAASARSRYSSRITGLAGSARQCKRRARSSRHRCAAASGWA